MPEEGDLRIDVSVVAPNLEESEFEGFIRVENVNNSQDFELIPVHLVTPITKTIVHSLFQEIIHKIIYLFGKL